MKVLVCGGRDYRNAAFVWRTLDELHARLPITALMQGGALGADRLAKEWAATHPEIERYVCRAGMAPAREGGRTDAQRAYARMEA